MRPIAARTLDVLAMFSCCTSYAVRGFDFLVSDVSLLRLLLTAATAATAAVAADAGVSRRLFSDPSR